MDTSFAKAFTEHMRKLGKKGGRQRAKKLSPKELSDIGRLGGLARQRKRRSK